MTYYIAHNNQDTFHTGYFNEGEAVSTGQPYFETFDNETDWLSRCAELGIELESEE